MIFWAAATWLMVIVLLAWSVHRLWCGLAAPRVVNGLLLPGTLVAQLGYVVGLLITGGTANNVSLMGGGDEAAPQTNPRPDPKIPVFGTILIGLLPLLTVGGGLYLLLSEMGGPTLQRVSPEHLSARLPAGLSAFWEQLRQLISLTEETVAAVIELDLRDWRCILFLYLLLCLTVRMAPLPGNVRGHFGAVVVVGGLSALAGMIFPNAPYVVAAFWPFLAFVTGVLLALLWISLMIRGLVGVVQMLRDQW